MDAGTYSSSPVGFHFRLLMKLGFSILCIALPLTSQLDDTTRNTRKPRKHWTTHMLHACTSTPASRHPDYRHCINIINIHITKRPTAIARVLRNARCTATATPVYLILSACLLGRRNSFGRLADIARQHLWWRGIMRCTKLNCDATTVWPNTGYWTRPRLREVVALLWLGRPMGRRRGKCPYIFLSYAFHVFLVSHLPAILFWSCVSQAFGILAVAYTAEPHSRHLTLPFLTIAVACASSSKI